MIIKFFSAIILLTLSISCSLGGYSSLKENIDEKILHKDIVLELSNEKLPHTLVLELNEEVDCNLTIEFYRIEEDTMYRSGSVDVSQLYEYDKKYQMDWYANKLMVKARSLDSSSCKSLDMDLHIGYSKMSK